MIDYLFIFFIMILGTAIVWEDMTKGKIRNALVAAGVIGGLFLFGIGFLWSLAVRFAVISERFVPFPPSYFSDVFVNFFISAICGYLLWRYKVWSAGDAKFFIMLALLLPLQFYENGYLPHFPSFALLINIFIPIFLLLLIKMCIDISLHFKKFSKNEIFLLSKYFRAMKEKITGMVNFQRRMIAVFSVFLLTSFFIPLVKYQTILILPAHLIVILIVFIAFYYIQRYSHGYVETLSKKKWFVPGTSLCMLLYFTFGFIYFKDLLFSSLIMTIEIGGIFFIGLLVFKRFSDFHIKQNEVMVVQRKDLRPKMVIAEELVETIKNDTIFSRAFGELYPEGISKSQVELLKEWLAKNGKEDVPIYKTFSFAPYIFAGVIITIVLKQSVVHLFLSLI